MEQKQKNTSKPYSPEFCERAVRRVMEHRDEYQSEAAALTAIAVKLGCSPDSLRVWARQVQRDGGERPGQTTAEKLRIKELEREDRELRQGMEDQKTIRGINFPDGRRSAGHCSLPLRLIPTVLGVDRFCIFTRCDRADCLGIVCKEVPSLTAGFDDLFIGVKDRDGALVGAKISPDVFDRVDPGFNPGPGHRAAEAKVLCSRGPAMLLSHASLRRLAPGWHGRPVRQPLKFRPDGHSSPPCRPAA